MSYTVLARRYRSTSFGQVIGQEMVAQALRNAIALDRLAHAFLFTGTRGVGKTSMARILARALNAPDTVEDCPRPPGEFDYPPSDVQKRIAEAVMRGDDLNVIEIDGASNNSVDQARQLIANASLSPTGNARYKVYIIDEVHMLSGAAFNALLKTMEEPPSHVKFILCTTEPQKVPATIQSRCQRFDFGQIPTSRITDHLRNVLQNESISAQDEVIWRVARLGNGSMRDALSLLDRLIAGCAGPQEKDQTQNPTITVDLLDKMLGLPPRQRVIELVTAMADGDVAGALKQTSGVLETGTSPEQFIDVLTHWLHQLMLVCACGPDSELVQLSDDDRDTAVGQSQRFDAAGLVYMIALCESLQRASKSSSNPRALLDATIVRLTLAEKMADVTALLSSASGGTKRAGNTGVADPVATKKKVVIGRAVDNRQPLVTSVAPMAATNRSAFSPSTPAVSQSQGRTIQPPMPSPASSSTTPYRQQSSTSLTRPTSDLSITTPLPDASFASTIADSPQDVWQTVLKKIADQRPMAWARNLSLRKIDGPIAHLEAVSGRSDLKGFVNDQRRAQLAKLVEQVLGRPVRVTVDFSPSLPSFTPPPPKSGRLESPPSSASRQHTRQNQEPNTYTHAGQTQPAIESSSTASLTQSVRDQAMKLPLVKQVLDVFDATIINVQPMKPTDPQQESPQE